MYLPDNNLLWAYYKKPTRSLKRMGFEANKSIIQWMSSIQRLFHVTCVQFRPSELRPQHLLDTFDSKQDVINFIAWLWLDVLGLPLQYVTLCTYIKLCRLPSVRFFYPLLPKTVHFLSFAFTFRSKQDFIFLKSKILAKQLISCIVSALHPSQHRILLSFIYEVLKLELSLYSSCMSSMTDRHDKTDGEVSTAASSTHHKRNFRCPLYGGRP